MGKTSESGRPAMKRSRMLALLLCIAVTLSLASCSSSSPSYYDKNESAAYDSSMGYSGGWGAAEEAYDDYEYESPAPEPDQTEAVNDLSSRKIIKNADLQFETTAYDEFLASLSACVAQFGGYAESSETYGGGIYSSRSSRSAYLTLRIPADRYDGFMETVSGLGAVTHRSESAEDVTMSYVDTESRLRALETEYETLLEILDKAESLEDVILLQSRISDLNYQMDSYKSQLRKYDDLISYCTVRVTVSEVWRETVPNGKTLTFGERIATGLKENLFDIGEGFSDFAVWFVTSLPYLLIWAVVIAAVVLIIRAIVRRTRKKKEKQLVEAYIRSQEHETENKKTDENP